MAADADGAPVVRAGSGLRGRSTVVWARLSALLEQLTGGSGAAVLDCGGGSGSLAVPLAQAGARVTVVDTSIDALSILLRRASEAGASDRVTAVQGEVESLVDLLPDSHFDLVLAHELLENVPNPATALAQISAVLRPGGAASLLVVNPVATVLGRIQAGDVAAALAAFTRNAQHSYQLDALLADCTEAGLRVDSVEGVGVFTELVPGIDLERPGAMRALASLEAAASGLSPYRDIASRLHVLARRADPAAG